MKRVNVTVSGRTRNLAVVIENAKTIWVRVGDKLIKRHKVKHHVRLVTPR